jgi:hypothetical protein
MKNFFKKLLNWELWSYDVLYFPVGIFWIWYAIRARAFWYFTPVNPTLVFAGFEGGSKWEMYNQLPKRVLPITLLGDNEQPVEIVKKQIAEAGLQYPFVAKPDTGMQGVMFTVVRDEKMLERFHNAIGEKYIVQSFISEPIEFSVFYIRYPGAEKGKITGMVTKDFLHVTGDGRSTTEELVTNHPVAKLKTGELQEKHKEKWKTVLPAGENYILNYAGNHRHGAKFINLNKEIDQRLHDVFDKISHETNQLYFGRYDLKCTSLEDMKQGKNIQVMEYNGAGAVTIHMFDCGLSYFGALKEIVTHWNHLYKIGRINNKAGVRYWSLMEGWRFMKKTKQNFQRLLAIEKEFNSNNN